jgi:hypothetical protein
MHYLVLIQVLKENHGNMINKIVYNSLISIQSANKHKCISMFLVFNNLLLSILNFFFKNGYIIKFIYSTVFYIKIFFKYVKNIGTLEFLKAYYKDNFNFSFKALKYLRFFLFHESNIYYISTPLGFKTLNEIFSQYLNIGGILYFSITY